MSKYLKYFSNNYSHTDNKLTHKITRYNNAYQTSMVNIQIEEVHLYKKLNISNMHTEIYDVISEIRFDFEIFREAYINQRKQYKLLQAYLDLSNELINEDKYDEIEELCTIAINDYNEEVSQKAIYKFLKNHRDYIENYEANELSELLGLSYKKVNKLIKNNKKNG